jgi:hypothetical protein
LTRFHEIVAGAAHVGVLLLLALAPTVCTADSALDLRTALRLARDAELQSALDAASLAAVEADRRSASAHPNPVISYGRLRPGRASTMFDGSRQQDSDVRAWMRPSARSTRRALAWRCHG